MNTLTHAIIGCGIRVHREIGPGVLENIYNECMQYELRQEGLRFDRERAVPLVYKGQKLKSRYYVDLVVEDRVIVELKTVVEIVEIHKKQVLTQLKLAGLHTGLILNFNVEVLTDGGVKLASTRPPGRTISTRMLVSERVGAALGGSMVSARSALRRE